MPPELHDMNTWIDRTGHVRLRSFTDKDGNFWLEQNPAKRSKWAKFVRDGHDVAWEFLPGGGYSGRMLIDGQIYTPSEATKKFLQSLDTRTMATERPKATSIDSYISQFSPDMQMILETIRVTIRQAAPEAEETISYNIPAFKLGGILVYFAAFKKHIGFYPPVRGDAKLERAIAQYAGEKGNLQFPLKEPVPYDLIEGIVKLRVKQNLSKPRPVPRKRKD